VRKLLAGIGVALVMGLGRAMVNPVEDSVYNTRGIYLIGDEDS
jgi:hypothetical protein